MLRAQRAHRIAYNAPKISEMKDTYLDVKACDEQGKGDIIEMQVLNVAGFEKRGEQRKRLRIAESLLDLTDDDALIAARTSEAVSESCAVLTCG